MILVDLWNQPGTGHWLEEWAVLLDIRAECGRKLILGPWLDRRLFAAILCNLGRLDGAIGSARWPSTASFQRKVSITVPTREWPLDRKAIPGVLFNILNRLLTIAGNWRLEGTKRKSWRCFFTPAMTSVWRTPVPRDWQSPGILLRTDNSCHDTME